MQLIRTLLALLALLALAIGGPAAAQGAVFDADPAQARGLQGHWAFVGGRFVDRRGAC